ncbi:class I SAM-dependent methyltransferase [Aeromonas sobria]|uniref:class I SAM-dependent methyltransferase n=1 Tax=Aeromonas sobria TaxID=646 RepID=UPI000C6E201E|nr:class I SAM-dependent methyltransferase [Aeromonas sobria]PKQ71366.1 hypothetical protein CJF47_20660 [Aeromonas sobria]
MNSYYIESIATDYRKSAILFHAIESGIFNLIEKQSQRFSPMSISEQSNDKLTSNQTEVILSCLSLYNIVDKIDFNTYKKNDMTVYLSDPQVQRGLLNYKREADIWFSSYEMAFSKSGKSQESEVFHSDKINNYLDMVKVSNKPRIELFSKLLPKYISNINNAMDLGGGHGAYSTALIDLYKNVNITLVDLNESIQYAKKSIDESYKKRMTFTSADARCIAYDGNFDFIMINDLLHSFGRDEKITILKNAFNALSSGGSICISKFNLSNNDKNNGNIIFSYKMMINTIDGYLESDEEVIDILRGFGMKLTVNRTFPDIMSSSIILLYK